MAKSILDLKGKSQPAYVPPAPKPVYKPMPAWCRFDWGVALDDNASFQFGDRHGVRISAVDYKVLDPRAVIDAGEENGERWALLLAHSVMPTSALTFRERYEDVWSYERTFGMWRVKGGEVLATPETFAELPDDWIVDPLYFWYMVNAIDLFSDYSDDYRVSSSGDAHRGRVRSLCERVCQQCGNEDQLDAWIAFFVACYNSMVSSTTSATEYLIDTERARKYWFKLT